MSLIRTAFAAIALAFGLLYALVLMLLGPAKDIAPAGLLDHPVAVVTLVFAGVGGALGAALLALHRRGLSPLGRFEAQIRALGERRFVSVVEPDIVEWVQLSKALNVMVSRVQIMLDERDARLAGLKAKVDLDALTGVASRDAFVDACQVALQTPSDSATESGAVAIVRVHDLVGMNQRAGRGRTDDLLRSIATAVRMRLYHLEADGALLARLNGADFAVLLPGMRGDTLENWLRPTVAAIAVLHDDQLAESAHVAWIGVSTYRAGEAMADVLSRCDAMIGDAETRRVPCAVTSPARPLHTISMAQWRIVIEQALGTGALHLDCFPVRRADGIELHREAMLRLRGPDGTPITAATFIPPAVRTGRILDIDLRTIALALADLGRTGGEIAVKVSPRTLARPTFHSRLGELLAEAPALARRLWIDVDEGVLDGGFDDLERLTAVTRPWGCRVGIEHFGDRLALLPRLAELRLDYVKLGATFCAGLEASAARRSFVDLVVRLAASVGLLVIAQGVRSSGDLRCLMRSGVDAATGPAVSQAEAVVA